MAEKWTEGVVAGRVVETPVGAMTIGAGPGGILAVRFGREDLPPEAVARTSSRTAAGFVERAIRQLEEYFEGRRTAFDVPLDRRGTPFQLSVWTAISAIPFGATSTYGDVARGLGDVRLARAVGAASGANPIPVIVPCHRLVGADGSLTGFGGGLEMKAALLRHESRIVQPDLFG